MDGARTTDLPLHTPLHDPLDHHGFIPTMHESLVFQPKISRVRAGSRAARDTPDRMSSPNGIRYVHIDPSRNDVIILPRARET